ncbi:hypothetical protein HMSSN036_89910 [Paenibacillus macerans]|nr:hypothetical protein HMSSN036_89910 [Paenibacillus macerans]
MDALLEFRSEHELLAKLFQEVRNFGTQQAREGLEKSKARFWIIWSGKSRWLDSAVKFMHLIRK